MLYIFILLIYILILYFCVFRAIIIWLIGICIFNIDKFWNYAENSSYVDNILKYMNKYERWAMSAGYKDNDFATTTIDEEYTQ